MVRDKRQLRKERRYVQSESRWMQKALFALGKAQDAREKLAASRNGKKKGESEPVTMSIGDESFSLEDIREAVQDRVDVLSEDLQERRQALR